MREILSSQSITEVQSPNTRGTYLVAKSGQFDEEGSGGGWEGDTETWEHRGGAKKFNEVQTLQTSVAGQVGILERSRSLYWSLAPRDFAS
ncbi:hypothetical protein CGRA01v4_06072 [Colletotrichum graminicola]|nr:hypothetical protein CGRA01v4_06072 [Colletotrichum graminicola]